jgi:hypothetical protein
MGEVYRATDTNLKRQVALKVLPTAFVTDGDRLARFQREAEVLAKLNDPHIAQIYGLEKAGDVTALVMELVEGPTLADRIAEGPIAVDETLSIAKQIAEALESAHEQGIIHRDLKPANIKVRDDGTVKVLDFGLAKALDPAFGAAGASAVSASMSPTITTPAMTQAGLILGTAAYMSPEQAKGRAVDKRSDVWAFGCVLYEMLTGKRAFDGEDVSDTLAAVLRGEPDWIALPGNLSLTIRTLLLTCLEKDRRKRTVHATTAMFVLVNAANLIDRPILEDASARVDIPKAPPWQRVGIPLAASLVGAVLAGVGIWVAARPAAPHPAIVRFVVDVPSEQQLQEPAPARTVMAVSSDGSAIVYLADRKLYLRRFDDSTARPIPGSEATASATSPVFSPDNGSIGWWVDGVIKRIRVTGGAVVLLDGSVVEPRIDKR